MNLFNKQVCFIELWASLDIKLFAITDHAGVLLFVVAHDVDKLEIVSAEQQPVEIFPVHFLSSPSSLDSLDQSRNHGPRSLHEVVEVPRGEEDPGLVALVGVDGVMLVLTANLVVSPFAVEHSAKQSSRNIMMRWPGTSQCTHRSSQILAPVSAPRSK